MSGQAKHDRGLLRRLWYRAIQLFVSQVWHIGGGLRASGRERLPKSGGAVFVSNHMSYVDVLMIGLSVPRPLNYVARDTLFVWPLSWLIRSVGTFPIQRDGGGASGIKETLKRLRAGSIVLFFPEGTRSPDGEMLPLKPGLAALVARTKVPVVPTGVSGTFQAWPKGQRFPKFAPVHVHYGEPIRPEDMVGLSTAELLELIRQRMVAARDVAARAAARLNGTAPRP